MIGAVTETPSITLPTFAGRFAGLAADAGARVAVLALPSCLMAAAALEAFRRIDAPVVWKIPFAVAAFLCLVLATLLATHGACVRLARIEGDRSLALHPQGEALRAAAVSALTAFAVTGLITLAAVGSVDLGVRLSGDTYAASWPWLIARAIFTAEALTVAAILVASAATYARAIAGRSMDFGGVAARLFALSTRTSLVLTAVIIVGTLSATLIAVLAVVAGLGPPLAISVAAKAAGFVAAVSVGAIGAVAMARDL